MNFLIVLFDAIAAFVRRNPITCIVILLLAVTAPSLLRGVAMFILYFIMTLLILMVIAVMLFRWRIGRVRRQMEEQFGGQQHFDPSGDARRTGHSGRTSAGEREGEVKIYKTAETPEKRVSEDVGDYVDFEETKERR